MTKDGLQLTSPVSRLRVSLESAIPADAFGVLAYRGAADRTGRIVDLPLEYIDGPRYEVFRLQPAEGEGSGMRFGGASVEVCDEDLESATEGLFRDLLEDCRASGHPHLMRIWAVVPGINAEHRGLEQYRAFSRARASRIEAAWGSGFETRLCASSAVGHDGNRLVIAWLASRLPGTQVENPRQTSAFHYPPDYGPRSPSFARGTIAPPQLGSTLFISGTASIVGHETVHRGDADAQTEETVRNVEALLAESGRAEGRELAMSLLKVFLRRPEDFRVVKERLAGSSWAKVPTLYLRADICRSDLLVEIEGVAEPVS